MSKKISNLMIFTFIVLIIFALLEFGSFVVSVTFSITDDYSNDRIFYSVKLSVDLVAVICILVLGVHALYFRKNWLLSVYLVVFVFHLLSYTTFVVLSFWKIKSLLNRIDSISCLAVSILCYALVVFYKIEAEKEIEKGLLAEIDEGLTEETYRKIISKSISRPNKDPSEDD